MQRILGVDHAQLGKILEVPALGRSKFLDSRDKKLSETTVEKLFALQEMLEYAEDTFGRPNVVPHWFQKGNRALGGASPLDLMAVSGAQGLENIRAVHNLLGQIKHGLYS